MPLPTFADLENYLSSQRLQRYLAAYSGDQDRAIKLYTANIKISQSFFPLLSLLEVILRNQINLKLSMHFGDPDWIINQRTGFMSDPLLSKGRFYLRGEVNK